MVIVVTVGFILLLECQVLKTRGMKQFTVPGSYRCPGNDQSPQEQNGGAENLHGVSTALIFGADSTNRPEHFEEHQVQFNSQLHRVDCIDSQWKREPPPTHVEGKWRAVQNGRKRESKPNQAETPHE